MKTRALLLTLLLATAALTALAPTAEARNVCSRAVDGNACPGYVCQYRELTGWYCEKDVLQEICFPQCWAW